MATEAQRRASAKYRKEQVRQVIVRFYPGEKQLLEYLEAHDSMAAYIKGLITDDMAKDLPRWGWVQTEYGGRDFTNGDQWIDMERDGEYVLHEVAVDGEHVSMTIHATSFEEAGVEANRILAKLAAGWRPVNW